MAHWNFAWDCVPPCFPALSAPMHRGQEQCPSGSTPIVQPGHLGHSSKIFARPTAVIPLRGPAEATSPSMQGMRPPSCRSSRDDRSLAPRSRSRNSRPGQAHRTRRRLIQYMRVAQGSAAKPLPTAHGHMNHGACRTDMKAWRPGLEGDWRWLPCREAAHLGLWWGSPRQGVAAKATGSGVRPPVPDGGMISSHRRPDMVEDLFDTGRRSQEGAFDFATDSDNTQARKSNHAGMLQGEPMIGNEVPFPVIAEWQQQPFRSSASRAPGAGNGQHTPP